MNTESTKAILSEMEEYIKKDYQGEACVLKIHTSLHEDNIRKWVTHIPESQFKFNIFNKDYESANRRYEITKVSLLQDCLVARFVSKLTPKGKRYDEMYGNRDEPAPDETLIGIEYIPCDIIQNVEVFWQ